MGKVNPIHAVFKGSLYDGTTIITAGGFLIQSSAMRKKPLHFCSVIHATFPYEFYLCNPKRQP